MSGQNRKTFFPFQNKIKNPAYQSVVETYRRLINGTDSYITYTNSKLRVARPTVCDLFSIPEKILHHIPTITFKIKFFEYLHITFLDFCWIFKGLYIYDQH